MQIGIDSFAAAISGPATGLTLSPVERMHHLLDEIELADKVGLDVFGIGEHHRAEFLDSVLGRCRRHARIFRSGRNARSRGSSPLDFAGKTGFLLTFLHVELTNMQTSENFDDLFFAHLKGIQPPFSTVFCDKFGQIRERLWSYHL
jgi:hypothetical protein